MKIYVELCGRATTHPTPKDIDAINGLVTRTVEVGSQGGVRFDVFGTLALFIASQPREIVICSAIRLPDGRVIRGHRHHDCICAAIARVGEDEWDSGMCEDQGFITSRNRYVGREEGMALQLAAGITSVAEGGYRGDTLFSEDLY